MEVLAMVTHIPLPILRGHRMIPAELANCLAFVGLPISILLATTSWGRKKAESK